MIPIRELAEAWSDVRASAAGTDWVLPDLALVWIETQCADAPGDIVETVLTAVGDDRGWVRCRSGAWDGSRDKGAANWRGESPTDGDIPGPIMWAEWCDPPSPGDEVSYRLAPNPAATGALRLHTFRERAEEAAGPWQPVLAQNVALLGHQIGRDLAYRIYWRSPDGAWGETRRLLARFAGFTKESR